MFEKNVNYIDKILVTGGNVGFVATATPLYTEVVTSPNRGAIYYNVAPMQPVIWVDLKDGSIPLTKTPATLTVGDLPYLHIGVGFDGDGDGLVESIREAGPDFAYGCSIKGFNGFGPSCDRPTIKALYPSCLGCETFAVEVRVSDNKTRSFGMHRADFASFHASYTPDCESCEDCEIVTPPCGEYMCEIVDQLNNEISVTLGDSYYPNRLGETLSRPYVAVKLQPYWYSYCITPESGTCVDCNKIDDLTTFATEGNATNAFVGVKNPADNTQTLISQLEYAALQIQNQLRTEHGKHGAWAVLSKGVGDCCGVQLHVVTCDEDFAITGWTPCESGITQFPTFSSSSVCQDCSTTTSSTTPDCGFAIIAKMDKYECDCFINRVPVTTARTIDIIVTSSNSKMSKYAKTATLQEGTQASGYGAEIQMEEYRQLSSSGKGFDFEDGNTFKADGFTPSPTSKMRKAITADCKKSYCRYELESEFPSFNGVAISNIKTTFAVPENDATTQTAVEALMLKLSTIVPTTCKTLVAIGCDGVVLE